jgi:hypothetical protein
MISQVKVEKYSTASNIPNSANLTQSAGLTVDRKFTLFTPQEI